MTSPPADARPPARAATIYEVARLAGVSHQTVSRYMADRSRLKATTSEKVERAMAELNYSPNLTARSLRTKAAYRLLALVPGGCRRGADGAAAPDPGRRALRGGTVLRPHFRDGPPAGTGTDSRGGGG